jgi:hypothetical protein
VTENHTRSGVQGKTTNQSAIGQAGGFADPRLEGPVLKSSSLPVIRNVSSGDEEKRSGALASVWTEIGRGLIREQMERAVSLPGDPEAFNLWGSGVDPIGGYEVTTSRCYVLAQKCLQSSWPEGPLESVRWPQEG